MSSEATLLKLNKLYYKSYERRSLLTSFMEIYKKQQATYINKQLTYNFINRRNG